MPPERIPSAHASGFEEFRSAHSTIETSSSRCRDYAATSKNVSASKPEAQAEGMRAAGKQSSAPRMLRSPKRKLRDYRVLLPEP